MEEGKLREGRGWLHPRAAGMPCRTRAGVWQHVPRAGPATKSCSWTRGEVGTPGLLKPPALGGSEPTQCRVLLSQLL